MISWMFAGFAFGFLLLGFYGILSKPRVVRRAPPQMAIGAIGERAVRDVLNRIGGLETLHDIYFVYKGRTVQVDHLVRCPSRIVCIETKHWAGEIAARDDGSDWHISHNGNTTMRQCPVRQNEWHIDALQGVLGCIVTGMVVFTCRSGHLTGRIPWSVHTLSEMPGALRDAGGANSNSSSITKAWEKARAWKANTMEQARLASTHGQYMQENHQGHSNKKSRTFLWQASMVAAAASGGACMATRPNNHIVYPVMSSATSTPLQSYKNSTPLPLVPYQQIPPVSGVPSVSGVPLDASPPRPGHLHHQGHHVVQAPN